MSTKTNRTTVFRRTEGEARICPNFSEQATCRLFDVTVTTRAFCRFSDKKHSAAKPSACVRERAKFENEVVKVLTSQAHAKTYYKLPSHPRLWGCLKAHTVGEPPVGLKLLTLVAVMREVRARRSPVDKTVAPSDDLEHEGCSDYLGYGALDSEGGGDDAFFVSCCTCFGV